MTMMMMMKMMMVHMMHSPTSAPTSLTAAGERSTIFYPAPFNVKEKLNQIKIQMQIQIRNAYIYKYKYNTQFSQVVAKKPQ